MSTLNSEVHGGSPKANGSQKTALAPLLEEAFICIENGEWSDAVRACERVLEQEPENAEAYFGKAMAAVHCAKKEALPGYFKLLADDENYQNALKFAAPELKAEMEGYLKDGIYNDALKMMQAAKAEAVCRVAAETFESISGWKDADARCEEALEKAEAIRKDQIYQAAVFKAQIGYIFTTEEAIEKFESIPGWRDADEQLINCKNKLEELIAAETQEKQENAQRAEQYRKARARKAVKIAIPVIIGVLLICAAVAVGRVLKNVVIPNKKYNEAIALLENEQYTQARAIFLELGDYRDSSEQLRKMQWQDIEAGDTLVFGNYQQEEVEWLVLAREGDRALLVSKYILDCRAFNREYDVINWGSSPLRTWLNSTFIESTFSENERAIIEETLVSNPDSSTFVTKGCEDTVDKVFLLSVDEAKMYFKSDSAREAQGTAYAVSQGLYVSPNGNSWWWLRSPGSSTRMIADVGRDGEVDEYGFVVAASIRYGVRPAMWLNIG